MSGRAPRGRARTRSDAPQPLAGVTAEAESGRGRGLPPAQQETTPVLPGGDSPPPAGPGGSPTGSNGNDNGSERSRDSSQQGVASLGRATNRGRSAATTGIIESNVIDPLSRLSLQTAEGERQQPRKQREFIESVPFTRPESCTNKMGKF